MKIISQGTFIANCVCDCGHEYIVFATIGHDGSKCPCCLSPEKFKTLLVNNVEITLPYPRKGCSSREKATVALAEGGAE